MHPKMKYRNVVIHPVLRLLLLGLRITTWCVVSGSEDFEEHRYRSAGPICKRLVHFEEVGTGYRGAGLLASRFYVPSCECAHPELHMSVLGSGDSRSASIASELVRSDASSEVENLRR